MRATNAANPVWLASGNNTSGVLTANGNATGELAWGNTTYNVDGTSTTALYAMSSNQGIQAFLVTIPEPGSFAVFRLRFRGLWPLAENS